MSTSGQTGSEAAEGRKLWAEPTAYYGRHTGVGLALMRHPKRRLGQPLSVGVIGLGAGTAVIDVARGQGGLFHFLKRVSGQVTILQGDARLTLEAAGPHPKRDVLVLDAFSGDSIPMHLMTREAFALYAKELDPREMAELHAIAPGAPVLEPPRSQRYAWTDARSNLLDVVDFWH